MISRHAKLLELIERRGGGYVNRSARFSVDDVGEVMVVLYEREAAELLQMGEEKFVLRIEVAR